MTEGPYSSSFLAMLRSVKIMEKLAEMPMPLTVEAYNRRLTYAAELGSGGLLSPRDIGEVEHNKQSLPKSQRDYWSNIFYAYTVEGQMRRKDSAKNLLVGGLNEMLQPDGFKSCADAYTASYSNRE